MTPNSWLEAEIARQIHINHLEHAQQARMMAQLTESRPPRFDQFRKRLGRWLVSAGQRLQPPQRLHSVHEI